MSTVCSLCSETFVSTRAYYAHLRPGNPDTVCLTTQELKDYGYERVVEIGTKKKGAPGRWSTWEELHEDKWDPDREFWSALFDPALLMSDLFPMKVFRLTPFEKFWGGLVRKRSFRKKKQTSNKDTS